MRPRKLFAQEHLSRMRLRVRGIKLVRSLPPREWILVAGAADSLPIHIESDEKIGFARK
jgi:hypothetical protein